MSKKNPTAGSFVDSPEFQAEYAKRAASKQNIALAQDSGQRIGVMDLKYDASEYNRLLQTGGDFGGTAKDIDGRLGDRQSAWAQWTNGVARFIPLVGAKLAGSLVGIKNVVEDAANGFDGSVYVDDELTAGIHAFEQKLKDAMPIYATTGYEDGGLVNQMMTAKFWADEALDGAAFMASSALITLGTAGAGTAIGGALGLAKAAGAVANASRIARLASSGVKAVGLGAFQASHEAAVEAYGSAESVKAQLEGKMDPETGMVYTKEAINARASQAAASTFSANMAALMLPAVWETRIVLGLGKQTAKGFANAAKTAVKEGKVTATELLDGVGSAALKKSGSKAFLKGAATGFAIEGLWEENLQSAIQNYDIDNAVNGKDPGLDKRTFEYASGMLDNLGTTEGQKAIVLGGVIGGPMGGFSARSGISNYNKEADKFVTSLAAANRTLIDNTRSYFVTHKEDVKDADGNVIHAKGSVKLNEQGQPEVDEKAAMALTQQVMTTKRLADKHAMAALQGNEQLAKLNSDISIGSAIWNAATNSRFESPEEGVTFLKWHHEQLLREQATQTDTAVDEAVAAEEEADQKGKTEAKTAIKRSTATDQAFISKTINDHLSNIDNMVKAFKEVESKAADLNKHDQSPERSAFTHVAKKGMFYERVKQNSIKDMLNDKQAELAEARKDRAFADAKTKTEERIEKEIEGLNGALQDSMEKYNKYYEETDSVFDSWISTEKETNDINKQVKDIDTKLAEIKTRYPDQTVPYSAEDEAEGLRLLNERRALEYRKDEILQKEGKVFKHNKTGNPTNYVRESMIAVEQSERVQQPTGLRYKYFERAATGVKALADIQDRIEDLQEDNKRIEELLDSIDKPENVLATTFDDLKVERLLTPLVAKMETNVPILDMEMKEDVAALIEARQELLNRMLELVTEIEQEQFITGSAELSKAQEVLLQNITAMKLDINTAQPQFESAVAESDSNQDLFSPEKIEDHLTETIARKYLDKGNHILTIALDQNGEINEEFRDVPSTESAIEQAQLMLDVMLSRTTDGDLQAKPQFLQLIAETQELISQLQAILESAKANQNNREAMQNSISINAATMLVEVLENPGSETAKAIDELLGGKLAELLEDAKDVNGLQFEALTALLNHAFTKGPVDNLLDAIEADRAKIEQEVRAALPQFNIEYGFPAFFSNPEIGYTTFITAIQKQYGTFEADNSKTSLLARFLRENNIYDIIERIKITPDGSNQLIAPKDELIKLYEAYKNLVALRKIEDSAKSQTSASVAEELSREASKDDSDFSPTPQQDMAIRDLTTWFTNPFAFSGNWAYLRGIAGTGKTNIVLKWMLRIKQLGLDPSQIVSSANLETAAGVVAKATGTPAVRFDDLQAMDLTGKRLVIIDEYGTLPRNKLVNFKAKVNAHNEALRLNATPGTEVPFVKVLILGDPTQISPLGKSLVDINNQTIESKDAGLHSVITPLTVVYRSDVSAVNEISDRFQADENAVESISTRSSKELGEAGAIGVQVTADKDLIISTIKANLLDPASAKRKRVIIVEDQASVDSYKASLLAAGITPGLDTVDVITVYDAQSLTFSEVYVDIPTVRNQPGAGGVLSPINKEKNLKFNTLMYTAISRAKEFAMVIYPDSKNVLDPSLTTEKSNNESQIKEARLAYQIRKAKEVQMFKNLQEGKPLDANLSEVEKTIVPAKPKTVTKPTEEEGVVEEVVEDEEADIATDDVEDETEEDEDVDSASEPLGDEGGIVDEDFNEAPEVVIGGISPVIGDNIPHIDKEGSKALKNGELQVGDEVFYIYGETPETNKNKNKQPSIQILAKTQSGKFVRIGQMFDKEFTPPMQPLLKREDIDAIIKTGVITPKAERSVTKTATISAAQYLSFKYAAGKRQGKGIQESLLDAFSDVFEGDPKVSFHIFSHSKSKKLPKLPKSLVGRPVAVVRPENADKDDFSNAFYVEMQALPIQEDNEQIVAIREFYEAAKVINQIYARRTGKTSSPFMAPGDPLFAAVARALKVAVKPIRTKKAVDVSKGVDYDTSIQAKEFTYEEFVNLFQEQDIANNREKGKPDKKPEAVSIPITEEEFNQMKPALQTIALGLFGFGVSKKKDENTGEYVNFDNAVIGEGPVQKAFNAIARANEYVGDVRIREMVPVKTKDGKTSKRTSGKSLVAFTKSNSGTLLPLLDYLVRLEGLEGRQFKARKSQIRKEIREAQKQGTIEKGLEGELQFLRNAILKAPGDPAENEKGAIAILEKKATKPVTLETLALMVDPSNFKDGAHNVTYTKNSETKPAYLRVPLNMSTFNSRGSDIASNKEYFESRVVTNFDSVKPTKIQVKFTEDAPAFAQPETIQARPSLEEELAVQPDLDVIRINAELDEALKTGASEDVINEIISRLTEAEGRRAFDATRRPELPDTALTIKKALAHLKQLIPNITNEEAEFVEKSILDKMANKGENLLGLFNKGKIYVALTDAGTIPRSVLRHEAFHKIFNEYLTADQRAALKAEIDPNNELSYSELDELLADTFMDWKKTPESFSEKVQGIFRKLMNWLGFAQKNQLTLKQLFQDIERGRFTKPITEKSTIRRAFSNIQKTFGNSMNYIAAMDLVESKILKYKSGDVENIEIYNKQELKVKIKAELESMLATKESILQRVPNHAETLKGIEAYRKLLAPGVFDRVWKTIYRGSELEKNIVLEDDLTSDEVEARWASEDEETSASFLDDLTMEASERDEESTSSDAVRDAVSYIQYRGKPINARFAYAIALKVLNGLHSGSGENISTQIGYRMKALGFKENSKASAVAYHLLDVFYKAELDSVGFNTFKGENIYDDFQLPESEGFVNSNVFVVSAIGESIAGKPLMSFREETEDYYRKESWESTPNFIRRIANDTYRNTYVDVYDAKTKKIVGKISIEEKYGAVKAIQIEEWRLKNHYRKMEAQKEASVLYSHFASHREATFFKGEMQFTEDGFQARYITQPMPGNEAALRNSIKLTLEESWGDVAKRNRINELLKSLEEDSKAKGKSKTKLTPDDVLAEILKVMGLDGIYEEGNNSKNTAADVILTLEKMGESLEASETSTKERVADDTDESAGVKNSEAVRAEFIEDSNNYVNTIQDYLIGDRFLQAKKFRSADGKNRFPFHLGSQALENVQRIIENNLTGSTDRQVSKHNIFKTGVGKLLRIIDHDAYGWKDINNAITYKKENRAAWFTRAFGFGFLGYANINTTKSSYIQFFYTNSNKPSQKGVEVKVLSFEEQKKGLLAMLDAHLELDDIVDIDNYNKYKGVNNDVIIEAIDRQLGTTEVRKKWLSEKDEESRKKLQDAYDRLNDDKKAKIVKEAVNLLNKQAEQIVDFMMKENVKLTSDISRVVDMLAKTEAFNPQFFDLENGTDVTKNILYNKQTKRHEFDPKEMLPIVSAWVANNYINGYFVNEVAAGNMNFFKNGLDMGKRLSSLFGMGKKGYIGKYGMKPTARVAILDDPRFSIEKLSEALKDTAVGRAILAKAVELADGQGFMLPERKDNLMLGLGGAYNRDVFKPIYSGTYDRTVTLRDGSKKVVNVPLILKDSVIVLTDELVNSHPLLNQLRESMRNTEGGPVEEVVMGSGAKEGAPTIKSANFTIDPASVFEIDNDKYRIQLDPGSKAHKERGTSIPTQIMYIINTMNNVLGLEENSAAADAVYDSIAKLYTRGLAKFKQKMLKSDGFINTEALANTMNPEANERVIALMENDVDINIPMLVDKVYSQVANTLTKFTTRIKFPGGKLVQQSSWGMQLKDANGKPRDLKVIEENGRLYAEVFMPIDYKSKVAIGGYLLPDALGYRIPSTGLNSIVGMKVVGFYPSYKKLGANIIVGPAELITQMGSDFDVDSLFVITRAIMNGKAVGYTEDSVTGKLVWNPELYRILVENEGKLNESKRETLEEKLLLNTIVENLMEIVSASRNKQRVMDVVSTAPIKQVLMELGIDEDPHIDLSNPMDNMMFHQSNFQGLDLTGIFATISKSLAYMVNTGRRTPVAEDGTTKAQYPELRKGVTIGETTYDKFTEISNNQELDIWQVLSALVNAAVDNVKDQLLYKMNASGVTGKLYGAALALGIPFKDSVVLMTQPVMVMASDIKLIEAKRRLVAAIKDSNPRKYKSSATNGEMYKILKETIQDNNITVDIEASKQWMNKNSFEGMSEQDLIQQYAILKQMETLEAIGEDISKFATMTSVIQGFPATYEELRDVEEVFDKIIEGKDEDGLIISKEYSFDITNFFNAQPNIAQAYNNMKELIEIVENNIFKHSPEVDAFIREIDKSNLIVLEYGNNRAKLKQELMSYLSAMMYSKELDQEAPYEYLSHNNERRVVEGKDAWAQRFIESFESVFGVKSDNKFLAKISVTKSRGLKKLSFAIDSNITAVEELILSEGFDQIEDAEFKAGLLKYAVLYHGLNFGYRNYSAYMSPTAFGPVSNWMKTLNNLVRTGKVDYSDEAVKDTFLDKIKEHFIYSLIANNGARLKGFPKDQKKLQQHEIYGDKTSPFKTVEIADGIIPVYSGMSEEGYFDREYENFFEEDISEETDPDKLDVIPVPASQLEKEEAEGAEIEAEEIQPSKKGTIFPLFAKETFDDRTTIFLRISPPIAATVRYVKLGFPSFGGYEVPAFVAESGYKAEDFFDHSRVPLRVQSTKDAVHENVYSALPLQPGTPVTVYNFNNAGTRDKAINTTVKTVSSEGNNRYTVEVHPADPINTMLKKSKVLSHEQRTTEEKMKPIVEQLSSRFGIPIHMVLPDQMPAGSAQDKGVYVNGTVYLNIALMTTDTAFHEIAHPIIDSIRAKNPAWYKSLEEEMMKSPQGIRLLLLVKKKYPELSKEEQMDEALVTLIGEMAAGRMDQVSTLSKLIKRLMRAIGAKVQAILKELNIQGLSGVTPEQATNIRLEDLAKLLTGEQSNIDPTILSLGAESTALDPSRTELDEVEIRLFKEGRITLSCK